MKKYKFTLLIFLLIVYKIHALAPAPANDRCSNASAVTCANTYAGTTVGATSTGDPSVTCGTSSSDPGVWYTYNGNGNVVTAGVCGASYDTKIQVFTGSCGSFNCVTGNDDFCSTSSQVTFSTITGTTYYIFVGGYSGATGTFNLAITCCTPAAPACASLSSPSNNATGENACGVNISWTAPSSSGCDGATSYDIYYGTSSPPTTLYTNTSNTSTYLFGLLDNTRYYWQVVSRNSNGTATGCGIRNFTTGTSPNPYYCLTNNATPLAVAGYSNCAQVTPEVNNQLGCVWSKSKINMTQPFDYTSYMYFGNNISGADGCAFVLQNSVNGTIACGNTGGQLGAGGIDKAVVIEFDTYDNDNPSHVYDMLADHISVEIDGDLQNTTPLCGPVQASSSSTNIDDGNMHTIRITWNPATFVLSVYFDGSLRLSCTNDFVTNVFQSNMVYWGFTGSTGGLNNQQYICPGTLPLDVQITRFSGMCSGGNKILEIETISDEENAKLIVQGSSDNVIFQDIAVKDLNRKSNKINFKVDNIYSYYRVKTTGRNVEKYSETINLMCDSGFDDLTVYNTSDMSNLQIATGQTEVHTFKIVDMTGKEVYMDDVMLAKGLNKLDIPSNTWSKGVYMLHITNSVYSKTIKVINSN